jgi:hypothetical protein
MFINYFANEESQTPSTNHSFKSILHPVVQPPEPSQHPSWVIPKRARETASPDWVLVKDDSANDEIANNKSAFYDRNSSSISIPTSDPGTVVPLGPRLSTTYGDNCVGLRFPTRGGRGDRGRDRGGRSRSYPYGYEREREPQFYTDGLQYVPQKGDSDIYRTVVIDMLPLGTKLEDVLGFAKEHPIISARLLDTSRMKLKGADGGVVGKVSSQLVFLSTLPSSFARTYAISGVISLYRDDLTV